MRLGILISNVMGDLLDAEINRAVRHFQLQVQNSVSFHSAFIAITTDSYEMDPQAFTLPYYNTYELPTFLSYDEGSATIFITLDTSELHSGSYARQPHTTLSKQPPAAFVRKYIKTLNIFRVQDLLEDKERSISFVPCRVADLRIRLNNGQFLEPDMINADGYVTFVAPEDKINLMAGYSEGTMETITPFQSPAHRSQRNYRNPAALEIDQEISAMSQAIQRETQSLNTLHREAQDIASLQLQNERLLEHNQRLAEHMNQILRAPQGISPEILQGLRQLESASANLQLSSPRDRSRSGRRQPDLTDIAGSNTPRSITTDRERRNMADQTRTVTTTYIRPVVAPPRQVQPVAGQVRQTPTHTTPGATVRPTYVFPLTPGLEEEDQLNITQRSFISQHSSSYHTPVTMNIADVNPPTFDPAANSTIIDNNEANQSRDSLFHQSFYNQVAPAYPADSIYRPATTNTFPGLLIDTSGPSAPPMPPILPTLYPRTVDSTEPWTPVPPPPRPPPTPTPGPPGERTPTPAGSLPFQGGGPGGRTTGPPPATFRIVEEEEQTEEEEAGGTLPSAPIPLGLFRVGDRKMIFDERVNHFLPMEILTVSEKDGAAHLLCSAIHGRGMRRVSNLHHVQPEEEDGATGATPSPADGQGQDTASTSTASLRERFEEMDATFREQIEGMDGTAAANMLSTLLATSTPQVITDASQLIPSNSFLRNKIFEKVERIQKQCKRATSLSSADSEEQGEVSLDNTRKKSERKRKEKELQAWRQYRRQICSMARQALANRDLKEQVTMEINLESALIYNSEFHPDIGASNTRSDDITSSLNRIKASIIEIAAEKNISAEELSFLRNEAITRASTPPPPAHYDPGEYR